MDRLIELNARDGYKPEELASFTCPRCGERPIRFAHPSKPPSVECRCCAPFSIKPELAAQGMDPWDTMTNADQWGLFVAWKLSQPCDEDEEEE
jgi:hypothetical protein